MKPLFCTLLFLPFLSLHAQSQKKPLDHTVYDGWQSVGERMISSDGRTAAYTVVPQEGDGTLYIEQILTGRKQVIPRGYHAVITTDNRYVIGQIKPFFRDTREAKIKKKKPEEMPKDSLFIFDLTSYSLVSLPNIKSYKTPEKGTGWVAWLADKPVPEAPGKRPAPDSLTQLNSLSRMADSLSRVADSLRNKAQEARMKGMSVLQTTTQGKKRPGAAAGDDKIDEGTVLTVRNLLTGQERHFPRVTKYYLSRNGYTLVMETTRKKDDTTVKAAILWMKLGPMRADIPTPPAPEDTSYLRVDTVIRGFNEAKAFGLDEAGQQLAFVLERDSAAKALRKFYTCWYYRPGMDSAVLIVNRHTPGVLPEWTVSENYECNFSKSGKRLFLGLAPVRPVKDTTLPEFEKAALDIWNYKDDQLQPVQLKNLERELKKSWLAGWDIEHRKLVVYGDEKFPVTQVTRDGDGEVFYTSSDSGRRIEQQWQGFTVRDMYAVDAATGAKKMVASELKGSFYPSYTGKYLLMYDERKKGYTIYNSATGKLSKIADSIGHPLYDEENDVPDDPNPYGIAGWEKDDKHVYIYDRYNIFKIDPETGRNDGIAHTPMPRTSKVSFRYVQTDPDEHFIDPAKPVYMRMFSEVHKGSIYVKSSATEAWHTEVLTGGGAFSYNGLIKADSADQYLYTAENYNMSPNLYVTGVLIDSMERAGKPPIEGWHTTIGPAGRQLSHLNPQQAGYNWGTAELVSWKAYTGRQTEGILYKPEGFDSTKKYPMIVYFYERNAQTLYAYQAPAPTPSRLNIPFFVSRGYLVFVPDIWYRTGHPGQSAYDYIMSGVRSLIKKGFVDSTKMGLQGQSWGGYQTAYLVTRTKLFAAAWAGAPVVNMFSAYGGIRWESGVNRQMQYEKTQSRIGATIWQRPDLYTENSPLFHLPAIHTPLVIMSNDADGAVPWYQGIEFFTAMRRLRKPVWLLEYNGEAHNLVERRNRRDIQVREQQFFDWLLKGEKAPKWITQGVPATMKGIDYGLSIE